MSPESTSESSHWRIWSKQYPISWPPKFIPWANCTTSYFICSLCFCKYPSSFSAPEVPLFACAHPTQWDALCWPTAHVSCVLPIWGTSTVGLYGDKLQFSSRWDNMHDTCSFIGVCWGMVLFKWWTSTYSASWSCSASTGDGKLKAYLTYCLSVIVKFGPLLLDL